MTGNFTIGLNKIIFDDEVRLRKDAVEAYLLNIEDIDELPSDIKIWTGYLYDGLRDLASQGFDLKSKGPMGFFSGASLLKVAEAANGLLSIPLAGQIHVQPGKYITTPHLSADSLAELTTGHGIDINSCGSIYMGLNEGHFWASGDYIHYDRANNRYLFRINNVIVGYVDADGFHNGAPGKGLLSRILRR